MASRDLFYAGAASSPLRRPPSTPRRADVLGSPSNSNSGDMFKQMLRAMQGLSDQVTNLKAARGMEIMELKQELKLLRDLVESNAARDDATLSSLPAPKRVKRANNIDIAEAVRHLHNSEKNHNKYNPKEAVNSPHNIDVAAYLLGEISISFSKVDPVFIKASCRTYFESLQKKERLNKPENAQEKAKVQKSMRTRQRKLRLFEGRRSVLRPGEELLWSTATKDLMSDEEDGFEDGLPVWFFRSPPGRSSALSKLCKELQERRPPGPRSRPRVLQNTMLSLDEVEDHNGSFTLLQL